MSNIWRAEDGGGNVEEFLSRDFDAYALADRLFVPFTITDVSDGGRVVAVVDQPEDVESAYRLEISWAR